jgi:amino acid transporter
MAHVQQQEGPERLGRGNLGLVDVVAQAIGFMGPVFSVTFFMTTIAGASFSGNGAGVATPISIIIAAVGMGGVAWVISRYAKRIHAAGALYDYVTEAFGRRAGFVAGWVYYGGVTVLTLAIGLAFGGFLSDTLLLNHDIDIAWWVLALAFWVVATILTVIGVQVSTRAQLILALGSMAVIGIFLLYVIFKSGGDNSAKAFNPGEAPSFNGILFGVLYAVIMFIGFESSANLAEETREPKRLIPRAMLLAVGCVGIYYVVAAYGLLVAFDFDLGAFLDPANFPPLYAAAAGEFGSSTFGEIIQWVVVLDIAAVGLGTVNASSRGLFALGRDGHLPRWLGDVNKRFRTPARAGIVLAIGAAIVIIVNAAAEGIVLKGDPSEPDWLGLFQWGAGMGGFCLVFVYLLISLSGFKGMPGEGRGGLAIAGVLGATVAALAMFGIVYEAPPFWALDRIWWYGLIWLGIGIVIMLVRHSQGFFDRPPPTAELDDVLREPEAGPRPT